MLSQCRDVGLVGKYRKQVAMYESRVAMYESSWFWITFGYEFLCEEVSSWFWITWGYEFLCGEVSLVVVRPTNTQETESRFRQGTSRNIGWLTSRRYRSKNDSLTKNEDLLIISQ